MSEAEHWSVDDVSAWLKANGLDILCERFQSMCISVL